ncbi:hypothetical protein [Pseudoruegeria sp. SHC-113]|uniref:hypothetical protein n=1 Tax=Pseudoruegeria sp. SHC-113 TaxID=2855439 RepID=UPI0021BB5EFE|nr:hypothetical protein [Pseudoruegeria sp. SHC-113]MCT8160574.1 hypothetical protein [Pseudoruegeria sp. SHC-113]
MAIFKNIVDSIDGSDDLAQAEREALDALEALATAKKELFSKQINLLILDAGVGTNKTVPISNVLRSSGMSRAYSSSNAASIPAVLEEAIGGFVEGGTTDVISGVFKIISKTLEIFLGSTEGRAETIEEYFVYATDWGIYRVDLMAWGRFVQAASIKTRMEQTTAFAYVLSNVDIDAIAWKDFVAIFGLQLSKSDMTEEEKDAARQGMLKTWNFLQGTDVEPVTLDMASSKSVAELESEYQIPLSRLAPLS